MKFIARVFIVLICFAAAAHAQPSPQQNPIEKFRGDVMAEATLLSVYLAGAPDTKALDTAKKGQDFLKTLVGPALAEAGDNADMKAAIKAFYIAADAYFESAFTPAAPPDYDIRRGSMMSESQVQLVAAQAKLRADLDSKNAALKLELQFGSD